MTTVAFDTTAADLYAFFRETRWADRGTVRVTAVDGSDALIRADYMFAAGEGNISIDGYIGNVPMRLTIPGTARLTGTR